MKFVFDSGPFINLFQNYYPTRFPSLWEKFDEQIKNESIISVREVSNVYCFSQVGTKRDL